MKQLQLNVSTTIKGVGGILDVITEIYEGLEPLVFYYETLIEKQIKTQEWGKIHSALK